MISPEDGALVDILTAYIFAVEVQCFIFDELAIEGAEIWVFVALNLLCFYHERWRYFVCSKHI